MFDIVMQICSILFAFFVFICKDVFCMSKQQNLMSLSCEVLWRYIVRLLLYELWRCIVWWIYQTIRRRVSEGRRFFFVLHALLRQLREHVTAPYWPAGTRSWASFIISVPCSQSIIILTSVFKCPPPHENCLHYCNHMYMILDFAVCQYGGW